MHANVDRARADGNLHAALILQCLSGAVHQRLADVQCGIEQRFSSSGQNKHAAQTIFLTAHVHCCTMDKPSPGPSGDQGSDEDSLFGSDSNPPTSPEGRRADEGEQSQPAVSNEPYGGLFGDDGDDDDELGYRDVDAPTSAATRRIGPAERYSTNVVQPPDPSTIKAIKLNNMININKQPFDPLTHVPGPAVYEDKFENRRLNLHHLNTVRWRWVTDPATGAPTMQSNARFVRWEDGSTTLHIGEEVLSVAEVQDNAARRYLYVRVDKLMQVCWLWSDTMLYRHVAHISASSHSPKRC